MLAVCLGVDMQTRLSCQRSTLYEKWQTKSGNVVPVKLRSISSSYGESVRERTPSLFSSAKSSVQLHGMRVRLREAGKRQRGHEMRLSGGTMASMAYARPRRVQWRSPIHLIDLKTPRGFHKLSPSVTRSRIKIEQLQTDGLAAQKLHAAVPQFCTTLVFHGA